MTPGCVLVPAAFFNPDKAREVLADEVSLRDTDRVDYKEIPAYDAVLIFREDGSAEGRVLPEMYYVLEALGRCSEYNKIVASWKDGWLYLAVAEGATLRLCHYYGAGDFTTAEYFIFLAVKQLQINPEVSTICFRTPLSEEEEMLLYRYFKSVERL